MADAVRKEGRWPCWLWVGVGLFVFAPLIEGGTTHTAVMVIRLLILVLLACYLWRGVTSRALAWPSLGIGLPIAAFLSLAAVSTWLSPYTDQSLQWLVVLGSYATLFSLLVFFIDGWDHVAKLAAVVVAMGLFEAVYALAEGWWMGAIRPRGTFFNPNFLAGYLAAAGVVTFGSLAYTARGGAGRPRASDSGAVRRGVWPLLGLRVWGLPSVLLALFLLAILLTGSRGGLLALLAGAAVVVGMRFSRRTLACVLAAALCLLLATPNPLRERLSAEHRANPETYARWQIWERSLIEMADHPLGIGLGLYQYWAPRYMFPVEGQIVRYGKIATTAHNEYLQMGVELGVLSLPLFGWGLWVLVLEAGLALRQRMRRWQRGLLVGLIGGGTALLVQAGVDSTWHEPALALLLTLFAALLLAVRRLSLKRPCPLPRLAIGSRPVWAILSLAIVAVLAWEVFRLGLAWQAHEAGSRAAAQQDVVQALADYRIAVALDPGKALYHSSLASGHFQVFERTGDPAAAQAAVKELQVAMSLNPLDGRLAALLGHVLESMAASDRSRESPAGRRLSLLNAARAAYERAVEREPFAAFYRLEVSRLSLALGDRAAAEEWVREAVELEPNFLPGREWLARLHLASGRTEAANRQLLEIRERQQRYAAWTKDAQEARYLSADPAGLEAAHDRARPSA